MTVSAIGSQTSALPSGAATPSTAPAASTAPSTGASSGASSGGLSSLFGSLTKRYRLLDVNGVVNSAAQVASASGIDINALLNGSGSSGASQAASGAAAAGSGTGSDSAATDPTMAAQQAQLQSSQAFAAQESALASTDSASPSSADTTSPSSTDAASPTSADPTSGNEASQANAIAQEQETTTLASEQTPTTPAAVASAASPAASAATGSGTGTSVTAGGVPAGTVTMTSTGGKKYDYWSAHIAQYSGPYLPDGPSMRPNCGPASVTMALRLVGLDIPGFSGQRSEAVLDAAREIGTGTLANEDTTGTTDAQLEKVITASGGQWSETSNLNQVLAWARQGTPSIVSGDPANGWDSRYSSSQVYPFDGGHWVTVSGYDPKTGFYIVNDPLSQIGPIEVSASELQSYMTTAKDEQGNLEPPLAIGVFNTAAGASSGSTTPTTG